VSHLLSLQDTTKSIVDGWGLFLYYLACCENRFVKRNYNFPPSNCLIANVMRALPTEIEINAFVDVQPCFIVSVKASNQTIQ